jgi:hypothetical protein
MFKSVLATVSSKMSAKVAHFWRWPVRKKMLLVHWRYDSPLLVQHIVTKARLL